MGAITILLTLASAPIGAPPTTALLPGTYTNEEEVYFAQEAKRPAALWTGIVVDASGTALLSTALVGKSQGQWRGAA